MRPDEGGLVEAADMHYVRPIEFRPDDLASPRATRRTDDFLSNLDHYEPAARVRGAI